MRLGLLMRVAILYKFILLVAVTCLVVAMYALAATYKQIVQSLVSRLLNSMSRAVVADPDADYAWFDDGRPARVPQVCARSIGARMPSCVSVPLNYCSWVGVHAFFSRFRARLRVPSEGAARAPRVAPGRA